MVTIYQSGNKLSSSNNFYLYRTAAKRSNSSPSRTYTEHEAQNRPITSSSTVFKVPIMESVKGVCATCGLLLLFSWYYEIYCSKGLLVVFLSVYEKSKALNPTIISHLLLFFRLQSSCNCSTLNLQLEQNGVLALR